MRACRNGILALICGLVSALLPSCAALTPAQNKCGNPCAAVSCPSAFRCDVDAQCAPRCQPEPAPKH